MNAALSRYCSLFSGLRRAPGPNWPADTKNRAPHKPMLLLAVLDLAARGAISTKFISIGGELTELNSLFTDYWRSVLGAQPTSSIAFPFSHLHNEPFWKLVPVPGREITKASIDCITTVGQLRKLALGANLDDEFVALLASAEARASLSGALLKSCFSADAQARLRQQQAIHAGAYQYSLALERHARDAREPLPAIDYAEAARDQGFRRAVVACYDHRCALCGLRIVTPEGHTAVDAAHIRPWSQFRDDDIRNGMALCKLCHWAFDEGLIGVSGDYKVITSREVMVSPNAAGLLLQLAARSILGPSDRAVWPSQSNLDWHRRQFQLS